MDAKAGEEEMRQTNWYFWGRHSATVRDHWGSESITTVYAVKAAIGQIPRTGLSPLSSSDTVQFGVWFSFFFYTTGT